MRRSILVAALVLSPSAAVAQVCAGLGSYDHRRWQVSTAGRYNREATSLGAGVGLGGRRFFYGGLVVSSNWTRRNSTAQSVAANAGYQFVVDRGAMVQWCPVGSAEFRWGPRDIAAFGTTVDVTEASSAWGVTVGVTAQRNRGLQVIPTSWSHS